MSIDMSLISVKDGGKFAMSWLAGTNPKALRSNFQRSHIHTVDIPEVCEDMMEALKSNEDKLSFRILFKLCLGTIHIYVEQVQELYNVTLNFLCFHTLVLKQCSQKRTGSTFTSNTSRIKRLKSSDSRDITSLLLESETFNEHSEDKFKFPKEPDFNSGNKRNTSTCIEIKQITIRQISWDNSLPENEEVFGEATQDDRMVLLSGLSENLTSAQCSNSRKRRSTNEITLTSSYKKFKCVSQDTLDQSIDDVRCTPSIHNDTMSEFSIDFRNQPSTEVNRNIPNDITLASDIARDEVSTQKDLLSQHQLDEEGFSVPKDLNEISIDTTEQSLQNAESVKEIQNFTSLSETLPRKLPSLKRRRGHLIIDKLTKLPKTDMDTSIDNIWQNCYNYGNKEHIAPSKKICLQQVFFVQAPSQRFQSAQLLITFKSNLRVRSKQEDARNRQLIIEEILGDEYEMYGGEFNLNSTEMSKVGTNKSYQPHDAGQRIEEYHTLSYDGNNNIEIAADVNKSCTPSNCFYENNEMGTDASSLKRLLDKVDPSSISFDFPIEAGTQRCEWGKEGILKKLLFAWTYKGPIVKMSTITLDADRINAALAFHTILDLAARKYVKIIKTKTNSPESIIMGPEMMRKLNETFV